MLQLHGILLCAVWRLTALELRPFGTSPLAGMARHEPRTEEAAEAADIRERQCMKRGTRRRPNNDA